MRSIHLHYIDSNGAGSNRKWAYQLLISPVMAKGDAYEKWKKKKVIISAACIIVVGLLIAGVYMYRLRNREYPVIKNIKLNGENYVREIYPEVEIRYPKVVVDEDSKEYVGTYKLENRCANANDNEKINRRKVKSYYCIDGLYEADNIQSLK